MTPSPIPPQTIAGSGDSLCGILVLDKPSGWTSHDAVAKMRRIAGTRKIGHLGTLDPLATGVLPLVVGKATRLSQFHTKDTKAYTALIRFGYATDTYDRDGEATSPPRDVQLNSADLSPMLDRFRGALDQMPPPISAKKINGVPAYKLARQNKPVELAAVPVTVHALDVLRVDGPLLEIAITCSAGTYIRSIAHELGQLHGAGAHVESLRRTQSGDFTLAQSRTLEQLQDLAAQGEFASALIQGAALLPDLPAETVDLLTESQIRQGRDFRTSPFRIKPTARRIKVLSQGGQLVAVAEQKLPNLYHPVLVL